MNIVELAKFPNCFELDVLNGCRCHESVLRSYQVLEAVKELLEKKTPPSVILDIVKTIEELSNVDIYQIRLPAGMELTPIKEKK